MLTLLQRAARFGSLDIVMPDGSAHVFPGREPGPNAHIVVHDWRLIEDVAARGDVGLGEAYMNGHWDSPDLEAFCAWAMMNVDGFGRYAWGSWLYRLKSGLRNKLIRRNTRAGSRRNILAHYDLGNDFYALWLDPSMSYSSGIYRSAGATLAEAQAAKYGRVLQHIGNSGEVLEIGCGWGGFMAEAERVGHKVTGLTISRRQHEYVRERFPGADVRLQDYRASSGRYPAIVSIEMLEAVGEAYWPLYFRTIRERLTPGGVAMVQTITIRDSMFRAYRRSNDYIREHIFPGGMLPTVPRIQRGAERAGLAVREVFAFGGDYARTLRDWRHRFDAAELAIAGLGYDLAFRRGWRLYLDMCAAAFAIGRIDVNQIELRVSDASGGRIRGWVG